MSNDKLKTIACSAFSSNDNAELAFIPSVLPSNDNQNLAVVQCTLNKNKLYISDFGVATGQEIGSINPKDILDAARIDSLKNVTNAITSRPQEIEVDYFSTSQRQRQLAPANDDKRKLQGGGVWLRGKLK